jgi:hypothetical protein
LQPFSEHRTMSSGRETAFVAFAEGSLKAI